MEQDAENIDARVRAQVYDHTMRTGAPPTIASVAADLSMDRDRVATAFRRLADAHMLVLQPDRGEILMAPPFSAVPTSFRVATRSLSAYANCIWDALGIPIMLHSDARIVTSCGDCGALAEIDVEKNAIRGEGLLHFAIPARQWWDDIVFT
ncbi:MAG: organomercurial lyase [Thermoanaerobaculia bacterium]